MATTDGLARPTTVPTLGARSQGTAWDERRASNGQITPRTLGAAGTRLTKESPNITTPRMWRDKQMASQGNVMGTTNMFRAMEAPWGAEGNCRAKGFGHFSPNATYGKSPVNDIVESSLKPSVLGSPAGLNRAAGGAKIRFTARMLGVAP
mmetsp:Transcript_1114/g.3186  ORF Transcript_1114/g.3186 Transcript_1114/m.3186 type:complete len:150 (-) Transcript_1114:113-562(-)